MTLKHYIFLVVIFFVVITVCEHLWRWIQYLVTMFRCWRYSRLISYDTFLKSYHRDPTDWDIEDSPFYICYTRRDYFDKRYTYYFNPSKWRKFPDGKLYFHVKVSDFIEYCKWRKEELKNIYEAKYDATIMRIKRQFFEFEISEKQFSCDDEYDKKSLFVYKDAIVDEHDEVVDPDSLPMSERELYNIRDCINYLHETNFFYIRDPEKMIDYELICLEENHE